MVESGKIDPIKAQYLDTYNQIVRDDVASTISTRTDANNDCYVTEPQTLTSRRTEEGRELRKQGIDVFANKELVPREDGVSGTLTSVQKDNLLAEPTFLRAACGFGHPSEQAIPSAVTSSAYAENNYIKEPKIISYSRDEKGKVVDYHTKDMANTLHGSSCNFGSQGQYVLDGKALIDSYLNRGGVFYKGREIADGAGLYTDTTDGFFRGGLSDVSRTLKAETHDAGVCSGYRIRKLTPRECFRLMDVSEQDIDKIQSAGISKSAQYRLAGNSIVVSCLYHIFRELFIDKTKPQQPTLF